VDIAARITRSRSFDLVVAVIFATLAQLEVWGDLGDLAAPRPDDSTRQLSCVLMLGILTLAVRRSHLMVSIVIVTGVVAVDALFVAGTAGFFGEFVPLMVLAYTAASTRDGSRLAAPGLLIAAGFLVTSSSVPRLHEAHDLLLNGFAFLGAVVIGRLVHRQHQDNLDLTARTVELEEQRETHAQAVLLVERARIAREIHDVIAHTISLMGVQAAAAEHVLDRDPERAREPLVAIQQKAREAIEELRRLLGVLREDAGELGLAPQPGLGALEGLVEQMRAAGLPVALEVEGHRRLSPGLELSAYRIVQEALTNTLKHAGTVPTTVRLRYGAEALDIRVTDHGAGRTGTDGRPKGHGIVGMRERVALHNGNFFSGPAEGGYLVHARLPLRQEP
jgi:signal transduction histidine kinase